MPAKKKRKDDASVLQITCYTSPLHFLWLKAVAAELSLIRGHWVKRTELWTCLVKRGQTVREEIKPYHRSPTGTYHIVVAFIDRKIEPLLNSLESEFGKRNPTLPVSDSLFLRSLVAHFALQETPHDCAERCAETVPAPRRDA